MFMKYVAIAMFFVAAPDVTQAADATALERIDAAYREGRVDAATQALLGFRLVRAPQTLPEEFRPRAGEPRIRCGTLLVRRAFQFSREGLFTAEQQAAFQKLGGRPSAAAFPDFETVLDPQDGVTPLALVHYNSASVDLAEAQAVANFLANSWDAEFRVMGFRAPPLDGGTGGSNPDDLIDFYLDPNAFGGYTQPENPGPETWNDYTSFVVIEAGIPNIETYVAHELHHASQFAYDAGDGDFIYEATATWIEDKVYDSVNDYTFFIADFQNNPSTTLSFATYDNNYMYGGAVFLHYLSDLYDGGGTALVRDAWETLKNNNQDWFDGVESQMSSEGFTGMADLYAEFAGYRLLTGGRDDGSIEEGELMGGLDVEVTYQSGSVESGETSDPIMGLGANYITVTTLDAEEDETLTFTLDAGDDSGPWFVTAVGIPASGSATVTVFTDTDSPGSIKAAVPDIAQFQEVGFVVSNAANVGDGPDSTFGSGADLSTHPFSWSFGKEDEPTGCGCHIPARSRPLNAGTLLGTLLFGAAVIVLRRR